jgi:hypothetical protein
VSVERRQAARVTWYGWRWAVPHQYPPSEFGNVFAPTQLSDGIPWFSVVQDRPAGDVLRFAMFYTNGTTDSCVPYCPSTGHPRPSKGVGPQQY